MRWLEILGEISLTVQAGTYVVWLLFIYTEALFLLLLVITHFLQQNIVLFYFAYKNGD